MEIEGVVKFRDEHEDGPPPAGRGINALLAWRDVLWRCGLIGRDPARYGGAGFGNASLRTGKRRFVVTGTQTGEIASLGRDQLTLVVDHDADANLVRTRGPVRASSESLTHAAVYQADPRVGCVLHAHTPEIWTLPRLPRTRASVPYGTPEMAREVARLFRAGAVRRARAFVMGGHEDGVITFGRDPDEAGTRMLSLLARALERGSTRAGRAARRPPP